MNDQKPTASDTPRTDNFKQQGREWIPIGIFEDTERELAKVTKERDDWKRAGMSIATRTAIAGAKGDGIVDAVTDIIEQLAAARADSEDKWRAVAAQVNHLLNLEAAYSGACEKREQIPFKWGAQPDRDLLQERANELAGEIMRTERRIIEGLKASASNGAALKPSRAAIDAAKEAK